MLCLGGKDAILRTERARAELAELAVEEKRFEIDKERVLFMLEAAAKIGRIKDLHQREALETAIFKRPPTVTVEPPRQFTVRQVGRGNPETS